MNNGDLPAMPLSGDAYQDFAAYDDTKNTSYNPECQGLTKREQFAMAAMQGILSNGQMIDQSDNSSLVWVAKHARKMADALLAELEKDKE